jgi:tetratricopeptide (TPR) repeat protein
VPLVLASVICVALLVLRRRLPGTATACAAYALVIAPVLGFTQAGPQLVADRYAYLATLPFALLAAAALGRLARVNAAGRAAAVALGLACLATLTAATRRQTRVWHDTESLWTHTLAHDPDHAIAHLGLGNERLRAAFGAADAGAGRERVVPLLRAAEQHFTRGFAALADPRFPTKLALLYAALAGFEPERRTEHLARAKTFSTRAVELDIATGNVNPQARLAHATNLLAAGDAAHAAALLAGYVREFPGDALGWRTLGQTLLATGDASGAASALEQATRLAPDDPYAWLDLARARRALGQFELARTAAERALALDPGRAAARELLDALR